MRKPATLEVEDPSSERMPTLRRTPRMRLETPVIRILAAWKTVSYATVTAVLTGVAVVAFGSTVYAQPGGGQGPPTKPVTVENPDTDPVPVSGAVTVGNLPAVQDVQVTNFPAALGAKQRVQIAHVTLIGPGDNGLSAFDPGGTTIFTVPAGKRLIVETVSALASDIEGVNYHLRLSARAAGAPDLSFLLTTKGVFPAATIPEKGRAAVTASATFIVEPEDELTYRFVRDVTTSPEEAGTGITVVGFLEDVP